MACSACNMNHKRCVLLSLGFVTIPVFIWFFAFSIKEGHLPFFDVSCGRPFYLPCPDLFGGKLQDRELKTHPLSPSGGKLQDRELKTHPLSPSLIYPQPEALQPMRTDVLTFTPWLAPIVWEGTFNSELLDNIYRPLHLTIGVTAFAIGKYIRFVRAFLESAEKHFMMGYRVIYYIFTDNPQGIPAVPLQANRTLQVILAKNYKHWQEVSLRRMEQINRHITESVHQEVDYLFCLDIDMKFRNPWGAETLGEMVAALHPGYYKTPRINFPYERRLASSAYIPKEEGDFYYAGAVFGGKLKNVYEFTLACYIAILADRANGLMAVWQEESHLNRYFLSHKPSKLLSPEYLFDEKQSIPPELKLVRLVSVRKDPSAVRE